MHQRTLARTTGATQAGKGPERQPQCHILQITGSGMAQFSPLTGLQFRAFRLGKLLAAGQPGSCRRLLVLQEILVRSLCQHSPTLRATAGAHFHKPVSSREQLRVMLHHKDGISLITQAFQRDNQTFRLTRVQTDGGFIENIKHTGKSPTNLAGQTRSLQLTTGKSIGRARKRQIPQAQFNQTIQTARKLLNRRLQSLFKHRRYDKLLQ